MTKETIKNGYEGLFESDFICGTGDMLDNAAYDLLKAMVGVDDDTAEDVLPWNMELIGDVVDTAEGTLIAHGAEFCRPYYTDNEMPCYLDADLDCKKCANGHCQMREHLTQEELDFIGDTKTVPVAW